MMYEIFFSVGTETEKCNDVNDGLEHREPIKCKCDNVYVLCPSVLDSHCCTICNQYAWINTFSLCLSNKPKIRKPCNQ